MSYAILVEISQDDLALDLTVEREGVGGVTGLTGGDAPTVAIRDGSTLNSYLDFGDLPNFKTAGWTTKYAPMSEVERGHYQRSLDVEALGLVRDDVLVAEYHVDDGGDIIGDDHDFIILIEFGVDMSLIRKSITNRMEESPGSPFGILVLYDDDSSTVLKTWELRDATGGGTVGLTGSPARRSKATP